MRRPAALAASLGILILSACNQMREQDKVKTFRATAAFDDGASAQIPPEGTVDRAAAIDASPFATGLKPGARREAQSTTAHTTIAFENGRPLPYDRAIYVEHAPVVVTHELIESGRLHFNINCAPCHGPAGDADGIIVQRGFPKPPSLHDPRLQRDPDGRLFAVITNGYGNMYSYASRVTPDDRWAIVLYIRALQESRKARVEDLTSDEKAALLAGGAGK